MNNNYYYENKNTISYDNNKNNKDNNSYSVDNYSYPITARVTLNRLTATATRDVAGFYYIIL